MKGFIGIFFTFLYTEPFIHSDVQATRSGSSLRAKLDFVFTWGAISELMLQLQ